MGSILFRLPIGKMEAWTSNLPRPVGMPTENQEVKPTVGDSRFWASIYPSPSSSRMCTNSFFVFPQTRNVAPQKQQGSPQTLHLSPLLPHYPQGNMLPVPLFSFGWNLLTYMAIDYSSLNPAYTPDFSTTHVRKQDLS